MPGVSSTSRHALWLILLLLVGCPSLHAWQGDSLQLPSELKLSGHQLFSTARLRQLLHAGTLLSQAQWDTVQSEVAQRYANEGRPFLELRCEVDSSRSPALLQRVLVVEGPRLVMGQLRVEALPPALPHPGRDLPPGRLLSAGVLEAGLIDWLLRLDQLGMGLARLRLRDFTLVPESSERVALDLDLMLDKSDTLRPGSLVVQGAVLTKVATLEALTGLREGQNWNPRLVAEARRRMLATGWFREVKGPGLGRSTLGLRWSVGVEEAPSYRLDGLAAWLPAPAGGGRWGYHLNLELANLMGTGREVSVLASRPEGWSQDLQLRFREPFVLGRPLSAEVGLRQRVQDSTWVEQSLWTQWSWEHTGGLKLLAALEAAALSPDSLNGYLLAGMDPSRRWEARVGVEVDQRDDPRNPRLGWQAALQEARVMRGFRPLGSLAARREDLSLRRQSGEVAGWWPLGNWQVVHARAFAGRLRGSSTPGQEDLAALGGLLGPRGTREQSLRAREWALAQLEWRYLLGPSARLAAFWDLLEWRDAALARHRVQGKGVALVLPVRQGQLEVQYALAGAARLREGLLHVRVVTRF